MGVDRRDFIMFALGGAAGTLFTPIPWKLTDDISIWSQNWPWIPRNIDLREEVFKPTVSKLCPTNVGLSIRTIGGKPVKAQGAADHPLAGGRISSLAGAEVQMLYSPARVKRPLRRSADGAWVSMSWDEAEAILEEKLGSIMGQPGKLACVSGDSNGSINEVLGGFMAKSGSSDFYLMPSEVQPAATAWNGLMGGAGQIGYDIENADMILAVGADILESWGPAVATRRVFADSRPHVGDKTKAWMYAGPVENNTATVADHWTPLRPGAQTAFLLSLASELIKAGAAADAMDFNAFKSMVTSEFSPKQAARITGVVPGEVERLAKALMAAERPLVIAGSEFGEGASAAAVAAGIAVNLLLGRLNAEGGIKALPETQTVIDGAPRRKDLWRKDLTTYISAVTSGKARLPEAMIFYEANPLYALPGNVGMAQVMQNVPFKVAFSSFLDETAAACDIVLPTPLGLERYDDVETPYGAGKALYCLATPVTESWLDTRPAGDFILSLAARLGLNMGFETYEDVLHAKAQAFGADWNALTEGGAAESDDTLTQYGLALRPNTLAASAKVADKGVTLAPLFRLNFGTAHAGTPPFGFKTIRDTELLGTESFVQMNSATASKLGVAENDKVRVESKAGSILARVHIFESVMDDVVTAPLGLGHTAFAEFNKGKGANIANVLAAKAEPGTGLAVWDGTGVTIAKA